MKKKKAPLNKLKRIRDEKIIKEFDRMVNITEHGVSKYSLDFIYRELEQKFFVEELSLKKIIKGRYHAKYAQDATNNTEQLKLFK